MAFLDTVLYFHERGDWKEILRLNERSEEKNASKILWVWPSESDLEFIKTVLLRHCLRGVTSVGCGCGLLEWIIQQYTGLPVAGIEINREWWQSKYSPPPFIPLEYVEEEEMIECNPHFALLFCYFNHGPAFREYVKSYRGSIIIIIGPHDGSGRHSDPQPFQADFGDSKWQLVEHREVKDTKDHMAVYVRQEE